jgi:hypothetical protein
MNTRLDGSVIVSCVVTIGFIGVLFLWLYRPIAVPNSEVLNVLVGTLAAGFGQVVNYWLGSSAGSKKKDETLAAVAAVTAEKVQPAMQPLSSG